MTKIKQTITEYLYKFTINSPVSQHKSTLSMHAGQRPRCISLVYFRLWAGYFRTLQLLSNQTENEGGRGGSHQEQTACPLSFNPISSLSSCFLYQTPLTPLPQLSSRRILQPRFWNTDSANQNVYNVFTLLQFYNTTFINRKPEMTSHQPIASSLPFLQSFHAWKITTPASECCSFTRLTLLPTHTT